MLVGFLLALCLWPIRELPWVWAGALLPGILDGAVQLRTAYESNNRRRLWTGILLGWGSMSLLVESFVWVWRLGWQTGLALKSAEVFCKIVKI